ncbi:type II secretion system F family protein, partial [bacterium]|nr:type II secretion system F family protein [bacterium]
SDLFEASQVSLPWITRFFLSLGKFFVSWGVFIFIFLILLVVALINYFRTREGKALWSEIQLRLPIFGDLFKKIAVVRFSQGVAVLLKGGISLPTAIEMGGKITANVVFEEAAFEIAEGVRRGESFSNLVLAHPQLFGEIVGAMIAVGEETGKIDDLLEKVAQYFQEDVDSKLSILSELIQPIIIVTLGIFVGTLVAAVLWPLYSLILAI